MKLKYYIFLFLFALTAVGYAQVEFTAEVSRESIGLNERLRVDFHMNKNGDNFNPPDFEGFKIYAGPRQSISRSWSFGKSTFNKTYSYFLQPTKPGTFTIGQATVEIDGKTYKTSPIEVEVTQAVNHPKNGKNQAIAQVSKGIHVVSEISNAHPYLNQGITVVYKLYVSEDAAVRNWRVVDIPKFTNFWNQDIDIKKLKVKYGNYQGQEGYRYVVIKKTVLYPQKSGELKIPPLSLRVSMEVPTHRRNFFGQQVYKTEDRIFSSESKTIKVKPLPEQGKPANFTGAVGQFELEVTASKETLDADESLDVEVAVSGDGNLKLFRLPDLIAPQAFEVYDPDYNEKIFTNLSGMHGKISNTYTLVPKAKGDYPIKPLEFSYFDPQTETYKTLTSKPLNIHVENGPAPMLAQGDSGMQAPIRKRSVISAGDHFRYIQLKTNLQAIGKAPFFKSPLFWTLLFMPLLLLPLVIGVGNKRMAKARDVYGKRIRRADKLAKKYLSEAKKTMGNQQAYYDALERALHNYLKAKLDLQTAEMSKERITELLIEKEVSAATSQEFIGLLESCEFARYTPSSDVGMQQDYDKAAHIISQVDKQIVKA